MKINNTIMRLIVFFEIPILVLGITAMAVGASIIFRSLILSLPSHFLLMGEALLFIPIVVMRIIVKQTIKFF